MSGWQLLEAASLEDVREQVLAVFRDIQAQYFQDGFGINPALPVELRGWQERDGWYEGLLLTPWMLAHLYVPRVAPPEPLPQGWDADSRHGADYLVIGPAIDVDIGEERPSVHLNYDPALGHYCLQPLVQSLAKYPDAEAVYAAWETVLASRARTRQQMLDEQEQQRQQQQQPLSRREFMTRWMKG
jgi:hypothetical protein